MNERSWRDPAHNLVSALKGMAGKGVRRKSLSLCGRRNSQSLEGTRAEAGVSDGSQAGWKGRCGWLLRGRGKKYTASAPSLLETPRGDGKEEVVGEGAGGKEEVVREGAGGVQGDCVWSLRPSAGNC